MTHSPYRDTRIKRMVYIAVMGSIGSGKSSFINLVSGSNLSVGNDLECCTKVVEAAHPFELDDCIVTLIDSPGFDESNRSNTDVLTMIAAYLANSCRRGETLSGIIYTHRISDPKVGGTARLNFIMFQELCGVNAIHNVAIVTNMWGVVNAEVGQKREMQLATSDKFFKPALDNGAWLFRHNDGHTSAHAILRHLVQQKPATLCIQRELVDQGLDITETTAGRELNRQLLEKAEQYREEMRRLEERMEDAIKAKDDVSKKSLDDIRRQLQIKLEQVEGDATRLARSYQEENIRLEERMWKVEIEAKVRRAKAQERVHRMHAEAPTERAKVERRMRMKDSEAATNILTTQERVQKIDADTKADRVKMKDFAGTIAAEISPRQETGRSRQRMANDTSLKVAKPAERTQRLTIHAKVDGVTTRGQREEGLRNRPRSTSISWWRADTDANQERPTTVERAPSALSRANVKAALGSQLRHKDSGVKSLIPGGWMQWR